MELKKEKSCGCIIINNGKVLLVYEKNRNFWGFPKGHMEEGETEIETALREVKEEVGLDVEIDFKKRYTLNYIIRNEIDKTTVLYIAKTKNEEGSFDNKASIIKTENQDISLLDDYWQAILNDLFFQILMGLSWNSSNTYVKILKLLMVK